MTFKFVLDEYEPARHYVADLGILGQADIWRQRDGAGNVLHLIVWFNGTDVGHLPADIWGNEAAMFRLARAMVLDALLPALATL